MLFGAFATLASGVSKLGYCFPVIQGRRSQVVDILNGLVFSNPRHCIRWMVRKRTRLFKKNSPSKSWNVEDVRNFSRSNLSFCGQDTHSQHTSVQYSLFRRTERTPRAWLKSHGLKCHLCAPEKNLSCGVAHVSPLVVPSPAVYHEHHLLHPLFLLPRHKNTRSTIGTT